MFELKRLSPEGVDLALKKVERYRLLNEPWQAESICLDILDIDPEHQGALISLVLAITDQFKAEGGGRLKEAQALIPRLEAEYHKAYYSGIIWERRATTVLERHTTGSGPVAYEHLRKAMDFYEKAQELRPERDESSVIRWNSCVRMITRHDDVHPAPDDEAVTFLE